MLLVKLDMNVNQKSTTYAQDLASFHEKLRKREDKLQKIKADIKKDHLEIKEKLRQIAIHSALQDQVRLLTQRNDDLNYRIAMLEKHIFGIVQQQPLTL